LLTEEQFRSEVQRLAGLPIFNLKHFKESIDVGSPNYLRCGARYYQVTFLFASW